MDQKLERVSELARNTVRALDEVGRDLGKRLRQSGAKLPYSNVEQVAGALRSVEQAMRDCADKVGKLAAEWETEGKS